MRNHPTRYLRRAEIAITRLDVLWAFGDAAMDSFTACYREQTDIDWQDLPRWNLRVALRPMGNLARWAAAYAPPPISRPDIDEHSMRAGHRRFVARAAVAGQLRALRQRLGPSLSQWHTARPRFNFGRAR